MDICTIVEFREALLTPEDSFATLGALKADINTLCRTRHFAECRATISGRKALIYAPITPQAAGYAKRAAELLSKIEARGITPFELHFSELKLRSGRCCLAVVEYPLYGTPLSEAVYTLEYETLISGLSALEATLANNNISHNNLQIDNIIVDNTSTWHLLRQYYTSEASGGDNKAFESLRQHIERHAVKRSEHSEFHEELAPYSTSLFTKENRQQVSENGLVGFNNEHCKRVVECKYLWASDFVEGRAMVTTPEGLMGLINSDGQEIIEARYEELEYDVETGRTWVCQNGLWAEFDYQGQQLSDWSRDD